MTKTLQARSFWLRLCSENLQLIQRTRKNTKEQKIKNKFNTISNPISWKKYLKFNLRNYIFFILSQQLSVYVQYDNPMITCPGNTV